MKDFHMAYRCLSSWESGGRSCESDACIAPTVQTRKPQLTGSQGLPVITRLVGAAGAQAGFPDAESVLGYFLINSKNLFSSLTH